jgi:hypothetical protein
MASAIYPGLALVAALAGACSGGGSTPDAAISPDAAAGTTLLLHATWSTAVGNTVQAVTDGGKARDPFWCQWENVLAVVPGGPLGWTSTPNVLRVQSNNGCGHVEFEDLFPLPTAQEQFWAVRYYVMNGVGQTDTKMHPHCLWPVGAIEAVHTGIEAISGGDGDWFHRASWGAGGYNHPAGSGGPNFPWYPHDGAGRRRLTAGYWFRYEFILHWLDETRYRVYPRLYDVDGTLLNDHTSWRHSDGAGTFAEYYAAGNSFTRSASSDGADHIRTLSFGMGQAGVSNGYYYVADVAAATVAGIDAHLGATFP